MSAPGLVAKIERALDCAKAQRNDASRVLRDAQEALQVAEALVSAWDDALSLAREERIGAIPS